MSYKYIVLILGNQAQFAPQWEEITMSDLNRARHVMEYMKTGEHTYKERPFYGIAIFRSDQTLQDKPKYFCDWRDKTDWLLTSTRGLVSSFPSDKMT